MKRLFLSFCILACAVTMQAQEALIDPNDSISSLLERVFPHSNPNLSAHMNLQFSTSADANFTDGKLDDAAFKMNRIRWELLGNFNKRFAYHFRQSFNKYSNPHALDNLSSSVEMAYVDWKMSDLFTLSVGKRDVVFGGYEYYVAPIKVREFSEFNNYVNCYQAGVTGTMHLSPTQELVLQVVNNRSGEDKDTYVYGLPAGVEKAKVPIISTVNWNGFFFDRAVQLRYAASWGQLADNKNVYYLTAGNIYEKGPVVAYVDLMYSREGLDSKGIISDMQMGDTYTPVTAQNAEYFTLIANYDYRIHSHWNVYVKGAYETASIYKSNGMFEKGLYRTTWNAQACVEFFPMKNSELLIYGHFLYKGHQLTGRAKELGAVTPNTQRVSVGLVYTIPVF